MQIFSIKSYNYNPKHYAAKPNFRGGELSKGINSQPADETRKPYNPYNRHGDNIETVLTEDSRLTMPKGISSKDIKHIDEVRKRRKREVYYYNKINRGRNYEFRKDLADHKKRELKKFFNDDETLKLTQQNVLNYYLDLEEEIKPYFSDIENEEDLIELTYVPGYRALDVKQAVIGLVRFNNFILKYQFQPRAFEKAIYNMIDRQLANGQNYLFWCGGFPGSNVTKTEIDAEYALFELCEVLGHEFFAIEEKSWRFD